PPAPGPANGYTPAPATVRVEGDAAAAPVAAAVDGTAVTASAGGEHATDLFGAVPAGAQEAQARAALAAEHDAAAEPATQDARQGSFDGFDLPADAAAAGPRAAPVAAPAAPAAAAAGDALAQAIASTDAVAEAAVREAEPAVDVTEVVAAVQEAVAGLAAVDGASADAVAARPEPAKAAAGKRGASRRTEPGTAKRKAEPVVPSAPAVADVTNATPAPVADDAVRQPAPAARPAPIPAPAVDVAPAPADAAPALDLDTQLRPLSERLRALQLETVDLRRAADREMRRVNRLLLALAAVVLIAIVALGLQTTALSSAHRDADELQRRVDRLTSLQETQQANLAAMQQRADELGVQVQRLTNRSAAAPRPQPARRERRTR
ncbi:MAG: hypothetical protein V4801_11910, partial [Burkholderia gladioli]